MPNLTINENNVAGRPTGGNLKSLTPAELRTIANVADNANNYTHPNHSGDVTSVADGAQTIANDAVTNAKAADMAANTIKMRNAGTTGDPGDVKISALTEEATPAAGDWLLGEDAAGNLRKIDVGDLPSGGGSKHVIQDESVNLTARTNLNFTGAGVTAPSDAGSNRRTRPGNRFGCERRRPACREFPDPAAHPRSHRPIRPRTKRFRRT